MEVELGVAGGELVVAAHPVRGGPVDTEAKRPQVDNAEVVAVTRARSGVAGSAMSSWTRSDSLPRWSQVAWVRITFTSFGSDRDAGVVWAGASAAARGGCGVVGR
ncbi:MAG TPA: hypothetical protein VFA83_13055 [Acidimicrobiales bacterium]|nr:hypothetical protein [Acidimicrobiales bacterium]